MLILPNTLPKKSNALKGMDPINPMVEILWEVILGRIASQYSINIKVQK
jgi:hypothetical protein